jgi:hypothetical protein
MEITIVGELEHRFYLLGDIVVYTENLLACGQCLVKSFLASSPRLASCNVFARILPANPQFVQVLVCL